MAQRPLRLTVSAWPENGNALVYERTIDGDTFVANGLKIRLWGIDAPEKKDPHFWAAKLYLEVLLREGDLSCQKIDTDRYKREVMRCSVDGKDLGSQIVQQGLAKDYPKYSRSFYAAEENHARYNENGMWKNKSPKKD